ncbi:unnamed protein product [Prorocentrum cordatum]|uniref:Uncharacterized protein n=1 Tax=Prorocentrum cordatum TaxID=2364126 RepID=A0ABN9T6K5_9DINO|nr:unnamed protein product [Polarella glacialis]
MALDPAALRIMLNETLRPLNAQMDSMNATLAGNLTAIKEMDGWLPAGDDIQAHSVRMDELELKLQRQQQGADTEMEQEHAKSFYERARDHPIKFTQASTGTQHDLRIGFDEPYDMKKKGYILGLIWTQICAYMRMNGCWTSTIVLACNTYQGLCYTTVRDEPIDLVMLSSWTESKVVVETCFQELRNFGPTEQQVQDLPAAVNSAYRELFTDVQHGRIIDQARFHEHIRIMQERALVLEPREHEQSPEYQHDGERTVKQHKLLKAWSPKHRRISLAGILGNQGHAPTSLEDSAARLAEHWGRAHTAADAPNVPPRSSEMPLAHCQKVSTGINWNVPLSDMLGFLHRKKDAAAGPDGVLCSGWAKCSMECMEILCQVRQVLSNWLQVKAVSSVGAPRARERARPLRPSPSEGASAPEGGRRRLRAAGLRHPAAEGEADTFGCLANIGNPELCIPVSEYHWFPGAAGPRG